MSRPALEPPAPRRPRHRRGPSWAWIPRTVAAWRRAGRAGALVLAVSFGLAGCSDPREAAGSPALEDLEQLAFVPPGSVAFPGRVGPPIVCENPQALLVDRFEVTRRAWRGHQERARTPLGRVVRDAAATWTEDTERWPATWMDLDEARAFAAARGMRLPTAREWLRVACGTRGLIYPWGPSRAFRVANTYDLALGRLAAVGTFELGATPLGTYDMCGNAWEWVEAPADVGASPGVAWALGGAFTSPLRRVWDLEVDGRVVFDRLELDPRARGEDVGFRCVVDAREYLTRNAHAWGDDERARARLAAVGRRFGRDAVPLLEELVRGSPKSAGLAELLAGAQRTSERAERAP